MYKLYTVHKTIDNNYSFNFETEEITGNRVIRFSGFFPPLNFKHTDHTGARAFEFDRWLFVCRVYTSPGRFEDRTNRDGNINQNEIVTVLYGTRLFPFRVRYESSDRGRDFVRSRKRARTR